MKNKRLVFGIMILAVLNSPFALGVETSQPATLPTKASQPIPSLQKTQNVDTVLSEKVQAIIAKLPILKGQAVSASSHDQIVTLEGSVENANQEKAAIKAARSVNGVKEVKSQLTIKKFSN